MLPDALGQSGTVQVVWPDGREHPGLPRLADVATGGSLPYQPIVSLGMRNRLATSVHAAQDARWWPLCAPALEETWAAAAADRQRLTHVELTRLLARTARQLSTSQHRRPAPDRPALPDSVAGRVVAAADQAGWLSCTRTMATAAAIVRASVGAPTGEDGSPVRIAYRREGHTSTVFLVDRADRSRAALNLARDATDATLDLRGSTAELDRWSRRSGGSVVRVHAAGVLPTRGLGRELDVAFSMVDFVDGCRELHVVSDAGGRRYGRMVEVHDFEHPLTGPPTLRAVRADDDPSNRWWAEVLGLLGRLTELTDRGATAAGPAVELNDGDLVAVTGHPPGGPVRMVACEPQGWSGPVGLLPYRLCLTSAGNGTTDLLDRLWWGRPELAVRAVESTLADLPELAADRVWQQAAAVPTAQVIAVAPGAPDELIGALVRIVRARGAR